VTAETPEGRLFLPREIEELHETGIPVDASRPRVSDALPARPGLGPTTSQKTPRWRGESPSWFSTLLWGGERVPVKPAREEVAAALLELNGFELRYAPSRSVRPFNPYSPTTESKFQRKSALGPVERLGYPLHPALTGCRIGRKGSD